MFSSRSVPYHLSHDELDMLSKVANKPGYPAWGWNPALGCISFEHLVIGASRRGFAIEVVFRDKGRISVKVAFRSNEFFSNAETETTYKNYVSRSMLNILNDLPNKQLEAFLNE
jgi:hypothetical protein